MLIAILFHRLGPYHHARIAAAAALASLDVAVIEFSRFDRTYAWNTESSDRSYPITTLFPDKDIDDVSPAFISKQMQSALDKINPDVVAVPGWSAPAALSALTWCYRNGKPVVIMSASTLEDEPRKLWREFVKKQVVMLGGSGLVGGGPQRDYMASLGISKERIFVGYDVVDNDCFSAPLDAIRVNPMKQREQRGLPNNYFLASSRFVEKKNLFRLLTAYSQYRKAVGAKAWSFILLGDGPLRPLLLELINELDLAQWVAMPGFKQYDELPYYYCLAGVFVHASTSEQWGLVVNEAMAAGLPVLVSERCGCAKDLINHGCNGYTFDPYEINELSNLMQHIASSECDRASMGKASLEIISNWTPATFAENLSKSALSAVNAPRLKYNFLNRALLWALMRK